MKLLKTFIQRILRLCLSPVRQQYKRRNGISPQSERKQLPNDALLGLASEKLAAGHTVTIWVKGRSMRPFLEGDRDQVTLERKAELHVGDAVLAQYAPGQYVLHRIIQLSGDHVTLQGDGNVRGKEHCLRRHVCGTVTAYIRPNRTIPFDDPQLVRRIRRWRRLRPLRRYLLFVFRVIVE